MKYRRIAVAGIAAGLALTAVGCSGSSSTPSESPTTSEHDMTNMQPGDTMHDMSKMQPGETMAPGY
jgi:hypothetical protein